jgi:hypothetical protein
MIPASFSLDAIPLQRLEEKDREQAKSLVSNRDGDWTRLLSVAAITAAGGTRLSQREMAPEIWTALQEMKDGESRIVSTAAGEFLIRRAGHVPAMSRPLESVRTEVIREVLREMQERAWSDFVDSKRKLLEKR